MPSFQYQCSLVAQFSGEIYKNAGASDVLPLVMGSLDAAMQFLRAGKVRVIFQDSQTCSQILEDGLDLGNVSVQLFPADERLRTVYIRDLPVEIEDDVVSSFLADFGEFLTVISLAIWPESVRRLGAHYFPLHVLSFLITRWKSKMKFQFPLPPIPILVPLFLFPSLLTLLLPHLLLFQHLAPRLLLLLLLLRPQFLRFLLLL